ncbi:MAG: purine-nucleoside phosphorylase [Candidatus Hydrogenedentes bacterium]|nr:purine-nucleoside phosphorylase [Candidatus Hydrogenedentota bacterium]
MTPAPLGIVAGSGIDLRGLLDRVEREQAFHEVAGLVSSAVPGHAGRFLHGVCGGHPVVLQCGRLHVYEGLAVGEVVRTVDVLASSGVRTILFTNAAGGLLPEMEPGELLAVERVRPMPYRGWPEAPESIEPDIEVPRCDHRGAYMWVHGPSYETRAEIAALQRLGGAAVGMSTAPELCRCRELGLRAAAVSCITNNCCQPQVLTHAHVVETACRASRRIAALIRAALGSLA